MKKNPHGMFDRRRHRDDRSRVAAFYAYRAMKPVIENASNYMDKAREVARLAKRSD